MFFSFIGGNIKHKVDEEAKNVLHFSFPKFTENTDQTDQEDQTHTCPSCWS